jgi:hypothetical protein
VRVYGHTIMNQMADLSYPIGRFSPVLPSTDAVRAASIDALDALPARLREAVAGLEEWQLDTPYRPGGWTVRQLVHHLADSHLNSYVRLKLVLTANTPTITPYDQDVWAQLEDSRLPIDPSLRVLDGVHTRTVALYRAMRPEQFARTFIHPEIQERPLPLDWQLQMYGWHSRHHVAHITALRRRKEW